MKILYHFNLKAFTKEGFLGWIWSASVISDEIASLKPTGITAKRQWEPFFLQHKHNKELWILHTSGASSKTL